MLKSKEILQPSQGMGASQGVGDDCSCAECALLVIDQDRCVVRSGRLGHLNFDDHVHLLLDLSLGSRPFVVERVLKRRRSKVPRGTQFISNELGHQQ